MDRREPSTYFVCTFNRNWDHIKDNYPIKQCDKRNYLIWIPSYIDCLVMISDNGQAYHFSIGSEMSSALIKNKELYEKNS